MFNSSIQMNKSSIIRDLLFGLWGCESLVKGMACAKHAVIEIDLEARVREHARQECVPDRWSVEQARPSLVGSW